MWRKCYENVRLMLTTHVWPAYEYGSEVWCLRENDIWILKVTEKERHGENSMWSEAQ